MRTGLYGAEIVASGDDHGVYTVHYALVVRYGAFDGQFGYAHGLYEFVAK